VERIMITPMIYATSGDMGPQELRRSLQGSDSSDMRFRRAVIGVSIVGIASMAIVSLFQTGIIKHLPDPTVKKPHFDSDKVNSADESYSYGMPDAPIAVAAHAANMVLAAAGPSGRAENRPWVPLLATAVSAAQARTAYRYLFHQMRDVEEAWCPYCVLDALTMLGTFALTLPESGRAAQSMFRASSRRFNSSRTSSSKSPHPRRQRRSVVIDPNLTGDPNLRGAEPRPELADRPRRL
jgi:uncharacterized membrane protein